MIPKTTMLHLGVDRRYRKSKATRQHQWPNVLFTSQGRVNGVHTLIQDPVFVEQEPTPVENWNELLTMNAPPVDLKSKKQLVITEQGNPFPLSSHEPPSWEESEMLAEAHYQEMQGHALGDASKKDLGNQTQMMAFRLLVIAFVLVASVMAASAVGVIGGN